MVGMKLNNLKPAALHIDDEFPSDEHGCHSLNHVILNEKSEDHQYSNSPKTLPRFQEKLDVVYTMSVPEMFDDIKAATCRWESNDKHEKSHSVKSEESNTLMSSINKTDTEGVSAMKDGTSNKAQLPTQQFSSTLPDSDFEKASNPVLQSSCESLQTIPLGEETKGVEEDKENTEEMTMVKLSTKTQSIRESCREITIGSGEVHSNAFCRSKSTPKVETCFRNDSEETNEVDAVGLSERHRNSTLNQVLSSGCSDENKKEGVLRPSIYFKDQTRDSSPLISRWFSCEVCSEPVNFRSLQAALTEALSDIHAAITPVNSNHKVSYHQNEAMRQQATKKHQLHQLQQLLIEAEHDGKDEKHPHQTTKSFPDIFYSIACDQTKIKANLSNNHHQAETFINSRSVEILRQTERTNEISKNAFPPVDFYNNRSKLSRTELPGVKDALIKSQQLLQRETERLLKYEQRHDLVESEHSVAKKRLKELIQVCEVNCHLQFQEIDEDLKRKLTTNNSNIRSMGENVKILNNQKEMYEVELKRRRAHLQGLCDDLDEFNFERNQDGKHEMTKQNLAREVLALHAAIENVTGTLSSETNKVEKLVELNKTLLNKRVEAKAMATTIQGNVKQKEHYESELRALQNNFNRKISKLKTMVSMARRSVKMRQEEIRRLEEFDRTQTAI